jgi:hypothetical protein
MRVRGLEILHHFTRTAMSDFYNVFISYNSQKSEKNSPEFPRTTAEWISTCCITQERVLQPEVERGT